MHDPPVPAELEKPKVSETTQVVIDKSLVVSCHTADDKKLDEKDCDLPNLDDLVKPRLDALTHCESAPDPSGMLSLGLQLDFSERKVVRVSRGKSTTINDKASKALVACAEREFRTASLEGIEHQHPKYLVFYLVNFVPPGTPLASDEPAEEGVVEASGTATVMWESAVIRKQPEEGGPVQARLLYGARVFVRARKGDWYRVKYDSSNREGWVHKNAIGM